MEFLSGGDLLQTIRTRNFLKHGPEVQFYMAEVICALEQLHQ